MSNRPNYKHVISLSEYKQRRIEEASILIELGDDVEPVVIPPPELWPDNIPRGAKAQAIAIIGQEEYERFLANGGSARLLDAIWKEMTEESQGVDPGKS